MKVSLNLRGPSRKAKYSLATDSEPSSASERWEEPLQGEDTEPETTCLQAVRARLVRVPSCIGGSDANSNFKIEIRNKFKIQTRQIENKNRSPRTVGVSVCRWIWFELFWDCFAFALNLFRISYFEIRISNGFPSGL